MLKRRDLLRGAALALVLALLCGCGKQPIGMSQPVPETPVEETFSPTPLSTPSATPVPTPTPESSEFADPAVRYAAEGILDKEERDFTEEDWAALAAAEFLEIEADYEATNQTLRDLPKLFPNLKGLHLTRYATEESEGVLGSEDCAILADMKLRFVEINASGMASFDFFRDSEYVQLSLVWDNADEKTDLADASVLGGDFVRDNTEGRVSKYSRATDGDMAYELMVSNIQSEDRYNETVQKVNLFVLRRGEDGFSQLQNIEHEPEEFLEGGLYLIDVDFDGSKDVVIFDRYGGPSLWYSAYLRRGNSFVADDQCNLIPNMAIDTENKKILSSWRNWAASHSWAIYEWRGEALVETARLTVESRRIDNDEVGVWTYTEERLRDGELKITEEFTENDKTEEELEAWLNGPDSFWKRNDDKWRSFKNMGSMSDFSIYGSGSINYMEAQILQ